jgi:hypothetical protein
MTLSGGGANKTVTVDGGWNANAIRDIGDSNGGPNQRSTYPVSTNRYVVEAPDRGSAPNSVPIDSGILNDYCHDEDGCWVSLYMRGFDPARTKIMAGVTARHFTLDDVTNTQQQYWDMRDPASNLSIGFDNNGTVQHVLQIYEACYFSDGEFVSGASTDNKPGFGLLNWHGAYDAQTMTCVLIIED